MAITYPLSLPTVTGFRASELQPRTVVGVVASPFTGQQQVYAWPGQWWQWAIELPPMSEASAAIWAAFFLALNGPEGTFYLGPSVRKASAAALSHFYKVGSGAVANSTTLPLGAGLGRPNAGDWLQVGAINRLIYAEALDNAAWTKIGATVSADADTAPDGAATADRLVEDGSSGGHFITQASAVALGRMTFSVYAKLGTATTRRVALQIYNSVDGTIARTVFDLNAGTVQSTGAGSAAITSIGSGWYRLEVSGTAYGAGVSVIIEQTNATDTVYTGDSTSYVKLWGAQLNPGSRAMAYLATTSAAIVQDIYLHRVTQRSYTAYECDVFPRLRAAYAANTPITTLNPVGLFRAAGLPVEAYDPHKLCQGMTFTAFESL